MEDIYVKNPQKAFKYAKMKLDRMEKIYQQMVELLPQTYLGSSFQFFSFD